MSFSAAVLRQTTDGSQHPWSIAIEQVPRVGTVPPGHALVRQSEFVMTLTAL
jgi:hypothetical protein